MDSIIYQEFKYVDDDTMKMRLTYMKRDLKKYFDHCFFQKGKKIKMIKWMLQMFPNDFNINKEVVYASSWSNMILCCFFFRKLHLEFAFPISFTSFIHHPRMKSFHH